MSELTDPANHAAEITPNDSANLANVSRAIYVGNGGDLKITTFAGETVTIKNVQDGTLLPIRSTRIFATGTTATNIQVWF